MTLSFLPVFVTELSCVSDSASWLPRLELWLLEHFIHPHTLCYFLARDVWWSILDSGSDDLRARHVSILVEMVCSVCASSL